METESMRIINFNDDKSIFVDEKALNQILNRKEIKDMFVSVISIVGDFRGGKSFFLNFLIRYLRVKGVKQFNAREWLDAKFESLNGFSYASGSQRHTTGIHIWPQIFCSVLPSGEKIAVILLDTQGTFDNKSTITECGKIFALSTLLSSVLIYNLSKHITQYHLSHLQCFSGYGALLNTESTPFQNLIFLVRDWPYSSEKGYGEAGGNDYLKEVFSSTNKEVRDYVDTIKGNFENVGCFLMPHPGHLVDKPNFIGNSHDIEEDFKRHLLDFATMILSPENFVIKSINGDRITAGELVVYLKEYCKSLEGDQMPRIEAVSKSTIEAQHRTAADKSFDLYKKRMVSDCVLNTKCCSPSDLYNLHHESKVEALKKFATIRNDSYPEIYNSYYVNLKNKMDKKFINYKRRNVEKLLKDEEMKKQLERQRRMVIGQGRMLTDGASTSSGLSEVSAETVGVAVGVAGLAAAALFGVFRIFSGGRNNDN